MCICKENGWQSEMLQVSYYGLVFFVEDMPYILLEIPFCLGYFLGGQNLFSHPVLPYTNVESVLALQNSSAGSEKSNKDLWCCIPIGAGRGSSCQWSVFVTEEQSAEAACSSFQPSGCPGRRAGRPAARSQQAKFNSHASKHW